MGSEAVNSQSGEGSAAVTLGFIPLVDCAPLVVAHEKGFAAAAGLELTLVREISWANIRDRVALGHFDAAHMLGPMPIASSLGIGRPAVPMVAPFSLGLGGNAVTVAPDLFAAMLDHMDPNAPAVASFEPNVMAGAFASMVRDRERAGRPPLSLAIVHPFSGHNYELRYWLAAAGLDPDRDVRLTVLPPSVMAESMAEGSIDGFCAGEPWNSLAVDAGVGVMMLTKSALWRQGPEKVLGVRTEWAERSPRKLAALLKALYWAADWAAQDHNHEELAVLLSRPHYVGVPASAIEPALRGRFERRKGDPVQAVPDFLVFHRHAANFPWTSHALWFYSQMVRWGHIPHTAGHADTVRRVYRPDLYRAALSGTTADLPRASAKVEGALNRLTPVASRNGTMMLGPDGFFDGRLFDPDQLDAYLGSFKS